MKPVTKRSLVFLTICAVVTFTFIYLWQSGFLPLHELETSAQDWQMRLGRKTPLDDRLVLLGIDKPLYESDFSDEELRKEPVLRHLQRNFPWSRAVWARLIEKLADAGAKVIIIDLVFATPGEGDEELRAVLEKYRDKVVIGYNISAARTDRVDLMQLQIPNPSLVPLSETNSPVEDDRLGFVNVWPDDEDNILRTASYRKNGGQVGDILPPEVILESLEARALRKFGHPELIPPGFEPLRFRYTAPAGKGYNPIPVGNVLSPGLWASNYGEKFFKGKIVLIGPTAEIFQDAHDTPFNNPKNMSGPEIHLQIINAALHAEFLHPPSMLACLLMVLLSGVLAGVLCLAIQQPLKRLLIAFIIVGAYWLITFKLLLLQNNFSTILYLMPPTLALVISSLIVLAYDFILERLERMKLRHTMGLYFSPRVLEAVLADPGSMQPRRADVILLLTDLRNSTPLAETLGPKGMFELLNRVFEAQTNAIMSEEGNLEHFLGDQFLSYWGAPQKQPAAADRAASAAMKLIAAMEQLRTTLPQEVQKLFGYGVALHGGSVLVGNKGSALRLDYGLVGDTVNEAARVEALTKYYGARMLVTRDAFAQFSTQSTHRLVDRVIVKGKSEPVELFECENPCTPPGFDKICVRYKAAYDEYFFGRFDKAKTQFDALAAEFSDGPSKTLAARCAELMVHPPENWHGVWKMDAK